MRLGWDPPRQIYVDRAYSLKSLRVQFSTEHVSAYKYGVFCFLDFCVKCLFNKPTELGETEPSNVQQANLYGSKLNSIDRRLKTLILKTNLKDYVDEPKMHFQIFVRKIKEGSLNKMIRV
jgi:hypothetical protein